MLIFAAMVVMSMAAVGWTQSKKPPERRARPPEKWDSRVLEAFFPDARTALSGPRPNYGAAPVASGNATVAPTTNGTMSPSAGGTFAWSKIISSDTLQDEIKTLQPQLADDVKTQQVFLGGAFKRSRRSLSMLAAAFAIISEYDGDVRWKNQATGARDLFARAGNNCKTATVQSFNEAKLRSEDLASMLRGETITAPANVEPKNDWKTIADIPPLMNRLELAQQERLGPWTSTAAELKKNSAAAKHEAEIIAALAEIIQKEGYEFAEDDTYREYANAMKEAAIALRDATESGNYDAARAAYGNVAKACTNCHGDFRN